MNEPIKLPLKITDDNRAGNIYLGTDDNNRMIVVIPQFPGGEPAKAIAEYIVMACNSRKDLLDACEAQHRAIDNLFTMLILLTEDSPEPFYPSQCGQPWEALCQAKAVIEKAKNM